jgi:uncharacterized protein YhhL (DUF1145 family)
MSGLENTLQTLRSDLSSKMSRILKYSPIYRMLSFLLLVHQLTLQLLDGKALESQHFKKED